MEHCNFVPIFYRFQDITIFLVENLCFFAVFTNPSLVWSPRKGCFPVSKVTNLFSKNRFLVLADSENHMILWLLVLTHYQRGTDGRTDTPPIANVHICIVDAWQRNESDSWPAALHKQGVIADWRWPKVLIGTIRQLERQCSMLT